MADNMFHSVRLLADECKGCTICIKRCPTEAIRVYQGKAQIMDERCIDCGECVRVCPNHAKITVADQQKKVETYKHKAVLLPPSFFGQFANGRHENAAQIEAAVKAVGFDTVAQVGFGAEHVALATEKWLLQNRIRPVIASACPVVVRLIQLRFEELSDHILPIDSPMEVTARLVRRHLRQQGIADQDIGVFFVSPCPAKVTAVKRPLGKSQASAVTGVIAMKELYGDVLEKVGSAVPVEPSPFSAAGHGMSWGKSDGVSRRSQFTYLSINGIDNVVQLLDEMVIKDFQHIDLLELHACPGGCVGGVLSVQNPFVAKVGLQRVAQKLPQASPVEESDFNNLFNQGFYDLQLRKHFPSIMSMDADVSKALAKISRQNQILEQLPGLDCGSCGSPNCRSLAEDIVQGLASENDCVFVLRESLQGFAEKLWNLSQQLPPTIAAKRRDAETEEEQEPEKEEENKM